MDDGEASGDVLTGAQVSGGLLAGHEEALTRVGDQMLRRARPMTRFLVKRIPGAPALVFNATELANAPNRTRSAFGLVGGALGGAAGGALGAAAGGVNAPIGAALGSTFGENVGEQIYDEHAKDIDRWMRDRWRELGGSGD